MSIACAEQGPICGRNLAHLLWDGSKPRLVRDIRSGCNYYRNVAGKEGCVENQTALREALGQIQEQPLMFHVEHRSRRIQ
jgi:hypothetical protein